MRTLILMLSVVMIFAFGVGLICDSCFAATKEQKETFGAKPGALGPIGGGKGYKKAITKGDFTVATEDELVNALKEAKPGQVVYVKDDAELDFTVRVSVQKFVLELPGGVTLASGRGIKGSKGALICSDEFTTNPLIRVTGPKARITGLRLQGPDPKMRKEELTRIWDIGGADLYYKFPTSEGINSGFSDLEVDNCEISGWSHGGVLCRKARPARMCITISFITASGAA